MKSVFRCKTVVNTEIVKNHENRVQILLPRFNPHFMRVFHFLSIKKAGRI